MLDRMGSNKRQHKEARTMSTDFHKLKIKIKLIKTFSAYLLQCIRVLIFLLQELEDFSCEFFICISDIFLIPFELIN